MKIAINFKRNLLASLTRKSDRPTAGFQTLERVAVLRDELREDVAAYDEHVYSCWACG